MRRILFALLLVCATSAIAAAQTYQVWQASGQVSPILPLHLDTYINYGTNLFNQGTASSYAQLRAETTYIEGDFSGTFDATKVCNVAGHPCFSLDWLDERIIYQNCGRPENTGGFNTATAGNPEGWYLHTTPGGLFSNRIKSNNGGCSGVGFSTYTNMGSVGASSALAQYTTNANANIGNINSIDVIGNDDTGCQLSQNGQTPFEYANASLLCTALGTWLSDEVLGTQNVTSIIYNGCKENPFLLSNGYELIKVAPSTNVLACRTEGFNAYTDDANGGRFQQIIDVSSAATARGGGVVLGPECCFGATESAKINWITGFQWLLYANPGNTQNAGTVAIQSDIEGGTFADVYPASQIYPDPNTALTSMTAVVKGSGCLDASGTFCTVHGHNDLCAAGHIGGTSNCNAAGPGVFIREFSKCYNNGVFFGVCAALVDVGTSSATIQQSWLHQTYAHSVTSAAGGGGSFTIDGGGTMNLAGAAFTCTSGTCGTLAAQSALLLTP